MMLIVGLGNIGEKYKKTRHNAGFLSIDYILDQLEKEGAIVEAEENKKLKAIIYKTKLKEKKIMLAKPTTLMNLSGQAIAKILQYYKIPLENLVVIFDDIDIQIGKLKRRERGSAGTHNGIKSIIKELGTEEFKRIKIGIESRGGLSPKIRDLSSFVLGKFNEAELQEIKTTFPEIYEEIKKDLTKA